MILSIVNELDKIWFKGIGGKRSTMKLEVELDGVLQKCERVIVTPKLVYECTEKEVHAIGKILDLRSTHRERTFKHNRRVMTIEFRIEQVSKKFQDQRFKIRLEATLERMVDSEPNCPYCKCHPHFVCWQATEDADWAPVRRLEPVYSTPVLVKTKPKPTSYKKRSASSTSAKTKRAHKKANQTKLVTDGMAVLVTRITTMEDTINRASNLFEQLRQKMLQMEVAVGITSQDTVAGGVEHIPGLCLEQDRALRRQSDTKRRRIEANNGANCYGKQQAAANDNEDEDLSDGATLTKELTPNTLALVNAIKNDMDAAKAADGEVPDFSSVVADMINDGEGLGAANTPLLQLNPARRASASSHGAPLASCPRTDSVRTGSFGLNRTHSFASALERSNSDCSVNSFSSLVGDVVDITSSVNWSSQNSFVDSEECNGEEHSTVEVEV